MTFANIRDMVMFQTGNDTSDYAEFEPSLSEYINEGYGVIQRDLFRKQVGIDFNRMVAADDTPDIPEALHRSIADYATYMVYRNGNVARQNRGVPFYQYFQQAISDYKAFSIPGKTFINMFNQ